MPAKRPIEKLTVSVELYDAHIRVKTFYYEGETLAATTGDTIKLHPDATQWKRRLTDMLDLHGQVKQRAKLWADQLVLF